METPLLQLFKDVYDLDLPSRRKRLSTYWSEASTEQRESVPAELDNALSQSSLYVTPHDYAFFLRKSSSISWATSAARASRQPLIVNASIDVLASHWIASPENIELQTVVSLVKDDLPHYATVRLFKTLGVKVKITTALSRYIDRLLQEIYPFLTNKTAEECSLSQYARLAIHHLVCAASEPVIMTIIKHYSPLSSAAWWTLPRRRPEIIRNIVLKHVGGPITSEPSLGYTDVVATLPSCGGGKLGWLVERLMSSKDPDTPEFIAVFLQRYEKYASVDHATHTEHVTAGNVIGLNSLVEWLSYLLRRQKDPQDVIRVGLAHCKALTRLMEVCREGPWSANSVAPLVNLALRRLYASCPAEWEPMVADRLHSFDSSQTPTGFLIAIFNLMQYSVRSLSVPSEGLLQQLMEWLRIIPRPARLSLINTIHYAKTGNSLLEMPEDRQRYPRVASYVVVTLDPDDQALILGIGRRAHDDFFYRSGIPWSYPDSVANFSKLEGALRSAEADSHLPHALHVGSSRTLFRLGATNVAQKDPDVAKVVESMRRRASKSREQRYTLTIGALALSTVAQSPTEFVETLDWAFKRYAKDPQTSPRLFNDLFGRSGGYSSFKALVAGPCGIVPIAGMEKCFNVDAVAEWCRVTNRTVTIGIDLIRTWAKEPDHQKTIMTEYMPIGNHICTIIQKRCELVEKIYPILYSDAVSLRQAMFNPLVELWIEWEKLRIHEYPQLLGFDEMCNAPETFSSLNVLSQDLPVVLPFLDKLGQHREDLYREARKRFASPSAEEIKRRRDKRKHSTRSYLPFSFNVRGQIDKVGLEDALELAPGWKNYVDNILFQDPATTLDDVEDKYDWHPGQFDNAVRVYVDYTTKKRKAQKVRELLDGYKHMDPNSSFSVLQHDSTFQLIQSTTRLNKVNRTYLPAFPSASRDSILLNPSEDNFRRGIDQKEVDTLKTIFGLRRRPTGRQNHELPLPNVDEIYHLRGCLHAAHQLTVLATTWIASVLGITVSSDSHQIEASSNLPVTYALRHVRMSEQFMKLHGSNTTLPISLLEKTLPHLHPSDVQTLLDAVFAKKMSEPHEISIRMALLGTVRRLGDPRLGTKEAFSIVEDTSMSSWHRQAVTIKALKIRRPAEAKVFARSLFEFSQEKIKQAVERAAAEIQAAKHAKATSDETRPQTEKQEDKGPSIKMSTQKMFIQLLLPALQDGLLSTSFIEDLASSGLLKTSPAITSYVVEVLVEAVISSPQFVQSQDVPETWAVIQPFIALAQRLEESTPLSEEDWRAAREGTGPMPEISDELPIACALLLDVSLGNSARVRKAWTKHVVEPILAELVNKRLRWMRTAIARESGGDSELEKTIEGDAYIDTPAWTVLTQTIKQYDLYLCPELDEIVDERSWWVWRFTEQRFASFLQRDRVNTLCELLKKNHGEEWLSKQDTAYSRNISNLTRNINELGIILVSNIQWLFLPVLRNPDTPAHLRSEIYCVAKRIGLLLLEPEMMYEPITRSAPRGTQPLASFLAVFDTFKLDAHTVPLVEEYLAAAEEHERKLSRGGSKINGGVAYWKVIVTLKMHLAKYNAGQVSDETRVEVYAADLSKLIQQIHRGGWRCIHFPHDFEKMIDMSGVLRDREIVSVVRALTQPPTFTVDDAELRSYYLDMATTLISFHGTELSQSTVGRAALKELLDAWIAADDGVMEFLATDLMVLYL
ncbi:hypothetical protein CONPUDRAFT_163888 [Coniophora puteana RWD-64-598 SS2]|uniref:Uncharacterized protein n=1 Tax=Coniophora puteana (strain RWD-64-598) TaxID=741705 RepID=A0A5M3MUV3_CONPW|nr:uncharacterized protein CONPUDRAFT_163888 [Coniophora puteana RWD-64-598 SS2]EIW82820.1 hypothetical protein CONPUDRAFT_163888 [Coniophora puteana RWD-64-598 SS2]